MTTLGLAPPPMTRLLSGVFPLVLAASAAPAAEGRVDFVAEVRPIFAAHCLGCHGPEKQQGGLRLDARESAFAGGDSGDPAVTAGDAAASTLLERVASADESLRMPPEGERLTARDLEALRRWVEQGAEWPDGASAMAGRTELAVTDADREHWAFRPLGAVAPPEVRGRPWAATPVDRFLLARMEAAGLAPTAEADRRTLIRRVSFDLVGLPPSPAEADEFAADEGPLAYERLVDRLLADPRYGERWGRHWLDLARYADTAGYELDNERPHAWRYRDFVVRAFNADMPYDRFVRWQIAGDEYAPEDEAARVATGFLGVGPRLNAATELVEEQRRYRYDELDDMLSTAGSAVLGLTVGCARCHDHKYDPIPTRDYYRLLAAFGGTKRAAFDGDEGGPSTPGDHKGQPFLVTDESAEPGKAWLLTRGDVMAEDQEVTLGMLQVLLRGATPEGFLAAARDRPGARTTTRRRMAVADWMTDVGRGAGNLAARVMANRVWRHHFGEGLVATPSDFGTRGDAPTHPELLEWLAVEFVRSGWSVKHLHRLIVGSAAYRQGAAADPAKAAVDPDNRLLWRRRPVRLEAEALRDAMLAVGGGLNEGMYGPGVKPPIPEELLVVKNDNSPYPRDARDDDATRRRSVYLYVKRTVRFPMMELFDAAEPTASCARRVPTTVAPQALALLNDGQVRRRAEDFAGRLAGAAADGDLVREAFRLALSREPTAGEADSSVGFLRRAEQVRRARGEAGDEAKRRAVVDFCQAMIGLNEFSYVD